MAQPYSDVPFTVLSKWLGIFYALELVSRLTDTVSQTLITQSIFVTEKIFFNCVSVACLIKYCSFFYKLNRFRTTVRGIVYVNVVICLYCTKMRYRLRRYEISDNKSRLTRCRYKRHQRYVRVNSGIESFLRFLNIHLGITYVTCCFNINTARQ